MAQPCAVGANPATLGRHNINANLAGLRLRHDQGHAIAHQPPDLDGFEREAQRASLDARQIKYLVDHLQQMLAGTADVIYFHARGLGAAYGRIKLKQLRKAEDGIQRGAQFVAHARQKFGF